MTSSIHCNSDVEPARHARRYWDAAGPRYLELFRDELEQKPFDRELLGQFAMRLPERGRVLDLGCGPCVHVSDLLRAAGLNVVGADVSPVCLELAKAQRPRMPLAVMDMASPAFVDAAFDGIVAYYAVHYAPKAQLGAILHECRRVLKPGGLLLLAAKEGADAGFVPDPLGGEIEPYFALFTDDELMQGLRAAGFELLWSDAREPYPAEIACRRIFVIAQRPAIA